MADRDDWYVLEENPDVDMIGRIVAENVHPSRNVPFWVLGAVIAGQRTFKVNGRAYRVTAGDYFLLPPNTPHHGSESERHDVVYFHFYMSWRKCSPSISVANDEVLSLPLSGPLPVEWNLVPFLDHLEKQFRLGRLGPTYYGTQLRAILYQLGDHVQQARKDGGQAAILADDILEFLVKNHTEDLHAEVLERQFFRSYRHLNSVFRKRFYTTIKQKVIDLRIQHAFQLLINGESLSSVVAQTGFTDYFYFLKCFKQRKGMTPKQLQKKYLLVDGE